MLAKCEEVLIVEDENGNIACDTRKIMKSLSSIYKIMRETLTYLCHEGNMINSRGLGYIHINHVTLPGGQELSVKNLLGTADHGLHQLQNEVLLLTTFYQVSKAVVALGCWTASGNLGQMLCPGRWLGTCVVDGGWGTCFVDGGWALASSMAAVPQASCTAAGHLRPGALGSSMHFRP